jgi:hypothetical protein
MNGNTRLLLQSTLLCPGSVQSEAEPFRLAVLLLTPVAGLPNPFLTPLM